VLLNAWTANVVHPSSYRSEKAYIEVEDNKESLTVPSTSMSTRNSERTHISDTIPSESRWILGKKAAPESTYVSFPAFLSDLTSKGESTRVTAESGDSRVDSEAPANLVQRLRQRTSHFGGKSLNSTFSSIQRSRDAGHDALTFFPLLPSKAKRTKPSEPKTIRPEVQKRIVIARMVNSSSKEDSHERHTGQPEKQRGP
jgi:hypothetical protein